MTMELEPFLLTVDSEPGRLAEPIGTVYGVSCLSKSLVTDFIANTRNWTIGGELPEYSRMIREGVAFALEDMRKQAKNFGADAVYGVRLSTTSVTQGAAELIAYGTAMKYLGDRQN